MASTNLPVTLAHAISFLTGPLLSTYTAATIIKLQSVLDANLTALYAPTWSVKEPLRGSARRALLLSPACLPPRSIYSACIAAGIQWFDWISALGGREFEFYVDPGCVAIRFTSASTTTGAAASGPMITVWADEVVAPALPTPRTGLSSFSDAQNAAVRRAYCENSKTLAQQLLEEDDEDEQIFDMIADEVSGPTWVPTQFPASTRSSSPLSSVSAYSRCSSRSSNSSSTSFSYGTSEGSAQNSPYGSHHHLQSKGEQKQSRREKPRNRVFIDTTKNEVTPYDGGKTTVLTGGVMLGGAQKAQKSKKSTAGAHTPAGTTGANSWRSVRA